MSFEGRVVIDMGAEDASSVHVDYRPSFHIDRLVRGKPVADAASLFPLIYSVCGTAQAHAAALALEAAADIGSDARTAAARAILTALESWRESLFRVVLDWPEPEDQAPGPAAARPAMAYMNQMKAALFGKADPFSLGASAVPDRKAVLALLGEAEQLTAQLVLGEACERFLARHGQTGLVEWAEQGRTAAAAFIRRLSASGWLEAAPVATPVLDMPDAIDELVRWVSVSRSGRHSVGGGIVPETTLYARRRREPAVAGLSGGIGARYAARLAELARLPLEMRDLALGIARPAAWSFVADGYGVAVVEAARGVLAHAVRIEGGRIADYRVASPTDWNFHARGIAARCLASIGDRADRMEIAHLVVRAIDPCVAYELRAG